MTSLYKIADEYQEAINFLGSCDELDQQTIDDTLEGLKCDVKDKIISVASYIKNLESVLDSIGICIEDLQERYRKKSTKIQKLNEYLMSSMIKCKIDKVESSLFDVKIKENQGRLVIEDSGKIPEFYKSVITQHLNFIDNAAIKEAIKSGQKVPGACIVKDKKITIK